MLKAWLTATLAAISVAVFLSPAALAKDKKRQEAEALLARARELSDIFCEGCPPLVLRARIGVTSPDGRRVTGTYWLVRDSPERWREEIVLGDFIQVEWGALALGRRLRSSTAAPRESHAVKSLIQAPRRLQLPESLRIRGIEDRTDVGQSWRCIQAESARYRREICFEPSTGELRKDEATGSLRGGLTLADYAPIGQKYFPRSLHQTAADGTIFDVRIVELAAQRAAGSSLFEPPQDAEAWPTCDDPTLPKPVLTPSPDSPGYARARRMDGRGELFVLIREDGQVRDVKVLSSPHGELGGIARSTVRSRWKFEPARCRGVPIPYEIIVEISFKQQL